MSYKFHVSSSKFQASSSKLQSGQSLFSIVLAIAVAAIVLLLVSQIFQVSLKVESANRQKTISFQLAQEAFEAAKTIAQEDWHLISAATLNQEYYPDNSGGKWALSTNTDYKTITLGQDIYTRWIVFNSVSRDANGDIEAVYNATRDDPSTRKITAYITKSGVQTISWDYYITRWENEATNQAGWNGESGVGGPVTSFGTDYSSSSGVEQNESGMQLQFE